MRLAYDAAVEEFRRELLGWLADNRPSPEEMAADPSVSTGHLPDWARRWVRQLFDAGWLVPAWSAERGGRDAGPIETLVYIEEMAKAGLPRTTNPQGLGIVVPSLFDYGNEAQIRDYAMPLLRGETTACVGMSEPGAGSDLASLSTRAELDGDRFVVNGQKVWTSGANYAEVCLLFCRTDTTVPKHKGISVLLLDMKTPGITVRPLPEIIRPGEPDLNEVFFSDVEVPKRNLVGDLNNGWAMANGSLAHERGMVWVGAVMRLEEAMANLLADAPRFAQRLTQAERTIAVDQVVGAYIDTAAARCLGYRGFAKLARGAPAPEQALMKVFTGEARQRLTLAAAEIQGADAIEVGAPDVRRHSSTDETGQTWLEQYLGTFANTISAGSSEIQRNIIAERVLGLPRDGARR